jgi:Flp pilus assembly protein TadD
VAVAAAVGWYGWRWYTTPQPPEVPLDNVEPAVVKAIQAARQQVIHEPRSGAAWGELGMVLEVHRFMSQAQVCYTRAEELDPQDRRWPYYLGMLEFRSNPAEGLRHLRQAARLSEPKEFEPRLRLAEALVEAGQREEAEQLFHELLKVQPGLHAIHFNLGLLAYKRGDFQQSLPFLLRAAQGPTTSKMANRLLAVVYTRLGQPVKAEQARWNEKQAPDNVSWYDPLREQITKLGVGSSSLRDRAIELLEIGRLKEAVPLLRDLVRDFPKDSHNYVLLAKPLYELGQFEEAERVLRKAVELVPYKVEVNMNLGLILMARAGEKAKKTGDFRLLKKGCQDAILYFQRVISIKNDNSRAHAQEGECYLRMHQEGEAIKAFQTALLCRPDYPEVHERLASILLGRGQDAEALVHYHYAFATPAPDRQHWYGNLARLISRSALWK